MHPQTHLVLGWSVGTRLVHRRDRVLVAWAGVAPDIDGLTILVGIDAYGKWHHVLTHGIVAAVLTAGLVGILAKDRFRAALLAFVAFHLHLLCDLLGSGVAWPITYLYPFSGREIFTPYGWELASWQNMLATVAAVVFGCWVGVRYGYTFVESVAPRWVDERFVAMLRRWFRRS